MQLARFRAPAAAASLAALALSCAPALAFDCAPTEGDECRFTVGALSVAFVDGIYSFDGGSQFNGSDGFVRGYTVGSYEFPDLTPVVEGPGRVGFTFAPGMEGSVGGSGFTGEHEASAWFAFTHLRFEAAPGWEIYGLEMTITGERRVVGVANVFLNLHATPVFNGDSFVALGSAPADSNGFAASFSAWTVYEEDGEGGAASYGTAYARFDSVTVIALMQPVPEPATWALWLGGALALGWRTQSWRRSAGHQA